MIPCRWLRPMRALGLPVALGLGTTVEVRCLEDALSTCRSKALIGLEQSGLRLGSGQAASAWLKQVGFPSHGVIFRPLNRSEGPFVKDLTHPGDLQDALDACRSLIPAGKPGWRPTCEHFAIPPGCARFVACVHKAPAETPAPRVHAGMVWRPPIRATDRGVVPEEFQPLLERPGAHCWISCSRRTSW